MKRASSHLTIRVLLFAMAVAACPGARGGEAAGLKSFGTSGKVVYPFVEGSKTEATLYEYEGRAA